METIFVSLGTNLGDRRGLIDRMELALGEILSLPLNKSALFETEPLDMPFGTPWFYNRIMSGRFNGSPLELLELCQEIETGLGRICSDTSHYSSRTADIDILLFGARVIHEPTLCVPHPKLLHRKFCLVGLKEISPCLVVPGQDKRIDELVALMPADLQQQKMRILDHR